MDKNQMKQILDQPLEPKHIREGTYVSFITDFYNRSSGIMVWWVLGTALFFVGLQVFSAVMFFLTSSTQFHIMFAALFIASVQAIIMTKIVYFVVVMRNRTLRDIKRLELGIAELNETLTEKVLN